MAGVGRGDVGVLKFPGDNLAVVGSWDGATCGHGGQKDDQELFGAHFCLILACELVGRG